jgi:hypothetical protein
VLGDLNKINWLGVRTANVHVCSQKVLYMRTSMWEQKGNKIERPEEAP